jgi:hypothetical protein
VLKGNPAMVFDQFGHFSPGNGLHHAVLAIDVAPLVNFYHKDGPGYQNKGHTEISIESDQVQQDKKDEQHQHATSKISDVLRLESFKLNAFIDALIDGVNAVVHDFEVKVLWCSGIG